MNRRCFLNSLALGGLTIFGATALMKAFAKPVRKGGPIEWSILENGQRIVYRFHKGPDYTNLEDAFPHMEAQVAPYEHLPFPETQISSRVVALESITLYKGNWPWEKRA